MLTRFASKRFVKMISLATGALLVAGTFYGIYQGSFGTMGMSAAEAAANSAIGVVDFQRVVTASPLMGNVQNTMRNEMAAAEKDFEAKAKTMSEQERMKYGKQLQDRLMNKENELMTPVMNSINAAIKKVADKKGLSVVVHKNAVIVGGVDITEDVVKGLK